MKFKNYKSAIHNFAHSFMSIDYMISGRLAINVLVDLHKKGVRTTATFDFLRRSIEPTEAISKESQELLQDYLDWLPDHFMRHNCDLTKLEKLNIAISADFDNATTPLRVSDSIRVLVITSTTWKADGRGEQNIVIEQGEVIKRTFLKSRLPEFK